MSLWLRVPSINTQWRLVTLLRDARLLGSALLLGGAVTVVVVGFGVRFQFYEELFGHIIHPFLKLTHLLL